MHIIMRYQLVSLLLPGTQFDSFQELRFDIFARSWFEPTGIRRSPIDEEIDRATSSSDSYSRRRIDYT